MQGNGMITPTLQVRAGSPLHTKKAKSAGRYSIWGSAPPALGGSHERSLDLFPARGAFAPAGVAGCELSRGVGCSTHS